MKNVGRIALCILLYMIAFDVIGVVASMLLDVAPVRGKTSVAFYAIWFVLGAFSGFIGYNAAGRLASPPGEGDWTNRPAARRAGLLALAVIGVLVFAIAGVSYLLFWQGAAPDGYFVPDSPIASITYFAALLAATVIAHLAFLPSAQTTPD